MVATKRIVPTVQPRPQVVEGLGKALEAARAEGVELNLPPIAHIKPPDMKHTSTKIRWYLGLGYTVKEVSGFLGVRYQQVRNVGVGTPKRAAREDVPPFVIECWEVDDDLEAMEAHALEEQMAAQRQQDREARKQSRRGKGPQRLDLENETEIDDD
jgi:hypothetical protein